MSEGKKAIGEMKSTKKLAKLFVAMATVACAAALAVPAMAWAADDEVAKVGDKKYTSLQDAINDVAGEIVTGEIVLIDDFELTAQDAQELMKPAYNRESYCGVYVPDDKTVVLDLNGHVVSYVDAYEDFDNVMVLNLGDLTIKDTSENKEGRLSYKPVASTSSYSKFYSTIFNCGTLTIEGGTIENVCETAQDVTNAVDNHSRLSHDYGNDCILTVNGGTLTGSNYYSIRQYTHYFEGFKNRVYINGGVFNNGVYMQHGDSWYYPKAEDGRLNVDCQLTIKGGTFYATYDGAPGVTGKCNNPDNENWKVSIEGGTFAGPIKLRVQRGTFYTNGVSGATTPAEADGTRNEEWLKENGGFITGGTFSSLGSADDPTINLVSFLAEGYEAVEIDNAKYKVMSKEEADAYRESLNTPPAPPYIPPAPPASTTVTIPVSGEENTVHAEVTVSGSAVEVKPLDPAEIEQIVGDDVQTGVVEIDLSGMDSDVTQVTLPVETLEAITRAAEDAGNDTESIAIHLPQGTVEIDDAAMRAVLDQAQGSEVVLVLESVGTTKLNDEQLEAIEGQEVHGGFEAYFECAETGERIGDFKGGTATLSVEFKIPEGKKASGFKVLYVSDEGKTERMKTFHAGNKLMWHVPHMSDYIVVYEDHPAYEDCERGSVCPLAQFPDVKLSAWYHDGLHWAVENSVLKGGDDGKMSPNQGISRQMLMVVLHRYAQAAGMNTAVYEDTNILSYDGVEDVSAYAMTAMQWACGAGVMKGYGDTDLAPTDVLTREQTATFLHRFAAYLGMDVSEGEDTNILSFADAFEISEWAMPAMQWACGSGVIGGYADAASNQTGELGPADGCTRAQAATMLMRFDAIA